MIKDRCVGPGVQELANKPARATNPADWTCRADWTCPSSDCSMTCPLDRSSGKQPHQHAPQQRQVLQSKVCTVATTRVFPRRVQVLSGKIFGDVTFHIKGLLKTCRHGGLRTDEKISCPPCTTAGLHRVRRRNDAFNERRALYKGRCHRKTRSVVTMTSVVEL